MAVHFVEVRASGDAGLGVFAASFIPKGTVWWSLPESGLVHISRAHYLALTASHQSPHTQHFLNALLHFSYYIQQLDVLIFIPDDGRYVNHSFTPNSAMTPDNMTSVTLRDVQAGEELFEDYTHYDHCPWARLYGEFGRSIGCWSE